MSERNETPALAVGGVDDGRCPELPRGARCYLRNGHPGDCRSYPVPAHEAKTLPEWAEQFGRPTVEVDLTGGSRVIPPTPFDAAVITASREGRRVFVAFDREGRPLPAGASVDRLGNLYDVDGCPLIHYDDVRRPGNITEFPDVRLEPGLVVDRVDPDAMRPLVEDATRGPSRILDAFRESEHLSARTTAAGAAMVGVSVEEFEEARRVGPDDDFDVDDDLSVDAARSRHRSACEEKRRLAYEEGVAEGRVEATIILLVFGFLVWLLWPILAYLARGL